MAWNRIVDLHVLLDARAGSVPLLDSGFSLQPLDLLEFVQADCFLLRLRFYQRPTSEISTPVRVRLSADTVLVFAGKNANTLGAEEELLFKAEDFTEVQDPDSNPAAYYYEALLDLNTTPLNAACDALPAALRTLAVVIDIENQAGAGPARRLTKQCDGRVRRQVYRGETPPPAGPDPYPPPNAIALKTELALEFGALTPAERAVFDGGNLDDVGGLTPAERTALG